MKQEALRRAQPLAGYLELTYACNWRCVFCYNPRHFDRNRLSGAEWLRVLDDLRTLGTLTVTITGGEPLAHPDFLGIARAARERAFALRIFTNAALVDAALAEDIAALHPQTVESSIHGATAETHDRSTGKPGSFDAMWRGLELLRERGVRLVVKGLLTSLNEHELEATIELVIGRGYPLHVDPGVTPRDDGDMSPLQYTPSRAAVARLIRYQNVSHALRPVQRDQGGVNCGLGRLTVAIDPEGNVFPCIQWRKTSLGNVRTRRLADMWAGAPERQEAAQVALDANTAMLKAGSPLAQFPFCPAVAFQRGGDPLVADEAMLHQATLAAEVRAEQLR